MFLYDEVVVEDPNNPLKNNRFLYDEVVVEDPNYPTVPCPPIEEVCVCLMSNIYSRYLALI